MALARVRFAVTAGLAFAIGVAALYVSGPTPEGSVPAAASASHASSNAAKTVSMDRLPVSFEPNRGQTVPAVRFLARTPGYSLFLTDSSLVLAVREPNTSQRVVRLHFNSANLHPKVTGTSPLPGRVNYLLGRGHDVIGVPTFAKVRVQNLYPGVDLVLFGTGRHLEYDLMVHPGADPDRVSFSVAGGRVRISGSGGLIIGHTGLTLGVPRAYQTVGSARVSVHGSYVIHPNGTVGFRLANYHHNLPVVIDPVIYQLEYSSYLGGSGNVDFGASVAVDASDNAYVTGFTPSTNFPTCPGSSTACSATGSALQSSLTGADDAFVSKVNPTGTKLIYSTYLGGSSDTYGDSIAVDSAGRAYITGYTTSYDFPTCPGALSVCASATGSVVEGTWPGTQASFVAELNPAGSKLIYSTFLGDDDTGTGIALNPTGAGCASSGCPAFVSGISRAGGPMITLPTCPGSNAVCQTTGTAMQTAVDDGYVAKLSVGGSKLIYSTFTPGSSNGGPTAVGVDTAGIAVDPAGDAYIEPGLAYPGVATLPLCPGYSRALGNDQCTSTANAPLQTSGVESWGFVQEIAPAGTQLVYSTYFGGAANDCPRDSYGGAGRPQSVAVDAEGNTYITGSTQCNDLPTCPGANFTNAPGSDQCVSPGVALQTTFAGYNASSATNAAFVAELNGPSTGSHVPGTQLVYSTYLNGTYGDDGFAIAVDSHGNTYVVGQTADSNFPSCPGPSSTPGQDPCTVAAGTPLQSSNTPGNGLAFVAELNGSLSGSGVPGTQLLYSTYLGGSGGDDWGQGLALDAAGSAYVTGIESSTNFPTCPGPRITPGNAPCSVTTGSPFQTAKAGGMWDAYIAKLMPAPPTAVCPGIMFTLNGKPTGTPKTAPCGANDFAVTWKPGKCYIGTQLPAVSIVFTFQGGYVSGDPPLAPCVRHRAVNGVEIFWSPTGNTNQITRACWLIAGACAANMAIPNGGLVSSNPGGQTTAPLINDACYEVSYGNGGIKKAYWTRNGSVYATIQVPPKANDVCWYGYGTSP